MIVRKMKTKTSHPLGWKDKVEETEPTLQVLKMMRT